MRVFLHNEDEQQDYEIAHIIAELSDESKRVGLGNERESGFLYAVDPVEKEDSGE